ELDQLGRRVAAEREGHGVQHLHALRNQAVEGDVVGEAAGAQVGGGKSQVVGYAVGDSLGREGVDEVPDEIGEQDQGEGDWRAWKRGFECTVTYVPHGD